MRSFVIGLVLLFALFTFVGAMDPPEGAVQEAKAPPSAQGR